MPYSVTYSGRKVVVEEQAKSLNKKPVVCLHGFLLNTERLTLHTKRRFKRICYLQLLRNY